MRSFKRALVALAVGVIVGTTGPAAWASPVPVQHRGYHPCPQEDSPGPCWWDAGSAGNGGGHSFYVTPDQRVVYSHLHWRVLANRIDRTLPDAHPCKVDKGSRGDATTCLVVGPWTRVGQSLADAMREGGSTHAQRDWQHRCFQHRMPQGERLVACVGGYRELG